MSYLNFIAYVINTMSFVSIIAYEYTDISNRVQMCSAFRYVSEKGHIKK